MKKPKKSKRMDPKLVSKEAHEVAYLAKKLGVSRKLIRLAQKRAGRGRIRVTAFVRGYIALSTVPRGGGQDFSKLDYSNASED